MARIKIEGVGEERRTRIGDCHVLDAQLKMYRSGKFFVQYLYEDLLQKLAEDMHRNVKADYDNVVMIEGGEGSGKSNLAWQVIEAYYDPAHPEVLRKDSSSMMIFGLVLTGCSLAVSVFAFVMDGRKR